MNRLQRQSGRTLTTVLALVAAGFMFLVVLVFWGTLSVQQAQVASVAEHDVAVREMLSIENARNSMAVEIHEGPVRMPSSEKVAEGWSMRERRIVVGDTPVLNIPRAEEGGVDMAPSLAEGAVILARRIETELLRRESLGEDVGDVVVTAGESGSPERSRALVHRVLKNMGRSDIGVFRWDGGRALTFSLTDQNHGTEGRLLLASLDGRAFRAGVLVDPDMMPFPATHGASWLRWIKLGMRSDKTTNPEYARLDVLDGLYERIVNQIFYCALENGSVDFPQRREFVAKLQDMYPRSVLMGLGNWSFQPVRVTVVDGEGAAETTYFEGEAAWVASSFEVDRVAHSVADSLRVQALAPWVRLGLMLGCVILAFLSWLRLDWWLNGRHALLSRTVFILMTIVVLTALWQWPIHG